MKNCFFKTYNILKKKKNFEIFDLLNNIILLKRKKKRFFPISEKLIKKNICIETGNNSSVYSDFYLSRINLRKNLKLAKINGLKKIS